MNFNKESFCPELWSQIEIDAQGDFKICCLANQDDDFGMALDENNQVMNILTHSISEAINSKTHKEHRLQLAQNIKPERCRNCYISESVSAGSSKRQRVLTQTAKSISEYITIHTAADVTDDLGVVSSPVVNLDIRFGNLCNYKCVMCSPQHSNLWYDDWVAISKDGAETYNRAPSAYKKSKYKIYPIIQNSKNKLIIEGASPWWETDKWWNEFERISPQLRYIYFTGGEPLIVPAMKECLDRLIKNGYAKNIQLRYDTNLSVINKKLIDKWQHFKKLFLCVSLDDTHERYDMIRYPGNYNNFLNNFKILQKNQVPINYVSSCIGVASPYAVLRVLEFCKQNNVEPSFRFLEDPDWLDLKILSRNAKNSIIKTLKESEMGDNFWVKAQMNYLLKNIDYTDTDNLKEFRRVMDILDVQRKINWKTILPDVHELVSKE